MKKEGISILINSPNEGEIFNNKDILVHGKLKDDNNRVSKVEVKIGSENWQGASGTTYWGKNVILSQDSNTIFVKAIDIDGTTLAEESVTVNYHTEILIHNLTAKCIGIALKETKQENKTYHKIRETLGVITLPPFGKGKFRSEEIDYEPWKHLNLIKVESKPEKDKKTLEASKKIILLGSSFMIFATFVRELVKLLYWLSGTEPEGPILGFIRNNLNYWLYLWIATIFGVIIALLYKHFKSDKEKKEFLKFLNGIKAGLTPALSLLFILIIGIGLPAFIIYFFDGGKGELSSLFTNPLQFLLTTLFTNNPQFLIGHGLQLVLIAIFSLLPALMYFLFTHQKLETLRINFFREIVHLDPKIMTLEDAKSFYENKVNAVYGTEESSSSRVYSVQSPIFVATIVITLGWILTLRPSTEVSPDDIIKYFTPNNNPIIFGFLGAYFFGLNMLFRRYARVDLRPKAFSHITVRILVAIILVWVLVQIPLFNNIILPLAFMVGFFPQTGITVIQDYLQKVITKNIFKIEEKNSLDKLDGINFYQKAQLLEEGIENIENLANHDLIDLMLQTRIPLPCLVDWIDQAILLQHVADAETLEDGSLKILHKYGIRTATDLKRAYEKAEERAKESGNALLIKLENEIMLKDPKSENKPIAEGIKVGNCVIRFKVILDTLEDDEWMVYIIHWRDWRQCTEIYTIDKIIEEMSNDLSFAEQSQKKSQLSSTTAA
jgi:hypothetical protein